MKAMRRRIALLKHFVQNYENLSSVLRKLWECARVLASLFIEQLWRRDARDTKVRPTLAQAADL